MSGDEFRRVPLSHPREQKRPRWHDISPLRILLLFLIIIGVTCALDPTHFFHHEEEHIRPKVSRVRADFKLLENIIETYRSDFGVPPPSTTQPAEAVIPKYWDKSAWTVPTTFAAAAFSDAPSPQPDHPSQLEYMRGFYDIFTPGKQPHAYIANDTDWMLWSRGPDEDYDIILNNTAIPSALELTNHTYDPTNGTISNGDIWRMSGKAQ